MIKLKSLSTRLKSLTLLWLTAALISIGLTLLLSWRLQGGGAAINDVGSLRMQTYRLAVLIQHNHRPEVADKMAQFEQTLHTLAHGDPSRPLFLPPDELVHRHMHQVQAAWETEMHPMFQAAAYQQQRINNDKIEKFIDKINQLAHSIETLNTKYINWLRIFQTTLLVLVLFSCAITMWLLVAWVIRPLQNLQTGVNAIYAEQFGVQITHANSTEFYQVNQGFNQMSSHLKKLYDHLEQEVSDKTQDLTHKNQALEQLYTMSRQLSQSFTTTQAAECFLQNIVQLVPAQAASVRLIDEQRQRLDFVAQIGLPEHLQTADACQRFDDCLCGNAVQHHAWQPIVFRENLNNSQDEAACYRSGFEALRVFSIEYKGDELGMLTLYFTDKQLPDFPEDLLETLCRQLGAAFTNIRLIGESRQLAVLQERNLMAQGLHDSIAQTLTFLNLQIQMLESALKNGEQEQANENIAFIREGVKECYDDVRELLLNFRTKISRKEFTEAVQTLAQRFEQQTHIPVNVTWSGEGAPLSAEQQLQFIFILQESLSNIRKHAQAQQVAISMNNQADFVMTIRDNGRGFDTGHEFSGSHVGLNIMKERAKRIRANLHIQSQPNQFTQINLTLPKAERILE
ncbi:type IV pili methyl-accepting chemotaxis transducer N-terminal domain-containing protein [Alysiella crassa]|uniref:Sensor protein n=1 Tax=Alysiella crassa TaxID=153491 RepID=A0A376BWY3_9NEIS|nr:type IV pili methyl-accepting chemotaxis transducer N-terminal domain-containing protein [Alysiella crassa]UOP06363.1 type IV pili methyl-accepting chemotaxis transducer N-terminal domain-containing protein [Alysiella crassa]SSY80874.1 Nitrate/nitrite sensor protein narX [Alysiella crassa]